MSAARPAPVRAIPVRHPWRWCAAVVILVFFANIVYAVITAKTLHWDIVQYWFFDGRILRGLVLTLELTALAMAIGVSLGIVMAVMRLSGNPVLSWFSWFYLWFFRGTPVYVQIIFWGNIALLFPQLSVGIPFDLGPKLGLPPSFLSADTNQVVTLFIAAVLGLGLNEGAYMAEIVRAGIIAVDPGQVEAAQALGMNRLLFMRRIVLPQAMRVIIPPTGNETISMLKTTSLVSVIGVSELLDSAVQIYAVNYRTLELLIVASTWYLIVTSFLTVIQHYVERYFARGYARER